MSESQLAKHLAGIFESELNSFLNLTWVEQLEKAEVFFRDYCTTSNSKNISLMFKALAEDEKQYLEETSEERKEFNEFVHRSDLCAYLDMQFQDIFYRLPYYFLFGHIICGDIYFQMDYEPREELRKLCGLTTVKNRRDAFTELFGVLSREEVTSGGDRKLFWNTPNRLYFLSIYNRFQIVIKNARKDFIAQKRNGKRESVAKREIIEKYLIPDDYSKLTFSDDTPANLAMDWAKKVMDFTQDSSSIKRDVLTKARKEAKEQNSTHKLVSARNINLNIARRIKILSKGWESEMRFPDFWTEETFMFYFI
jgi:hypothetical protein